jgi:hypothetical protein
MTARNWIEPLGNTANRALQDLAAEGIWRHGIIYNPWALMTETTARRTGIVGARRAGDDTEHKRYKISRSRTTGNEPKNRREQVCEMVLLLVPG